MKKNTFYMLALAAIAAAAISCEREQSPAGEDIPAGSEFVFTASTDQARSKTTVENGEGTERIVKWAAGDEISVYWDGGNTTATAGAAGTSTTFTPSGTPSGDMYYAAYPSSVATAFSDGALTVKIPATQDGSFANANIAVAKTTDLERDFQFTNLTALVKFTVSGSYTKAVFRGAKGETLAGTLPVDMSGAPVLGKVSTPAKEIEVTLNGAGDYYISVLPCTLEGGFSISLYNGDTTAPAAYLPVEVALERATITNLGAIDGRSISNYFVTPSGAGKKNGRTWENALGTAELRALIKQPMNGTSQDNAAAFNKAAILDGVTFHMAAGDYYLAEGTEENYVKVDYTGYGEKVEMTFLGGYPAGLTGTTTAGRDTTQYRTAFTGNNETGILTIGDKVDAIFEGLTFKDVSTTTPEYGALRVNGDGSAVTLKSCRFVNNVNSDSSKSGASVILDGGALTVENSYFAGNLARNAGALFLISGEGPVSVTNCLFYNNRGVNTSGAAQNAGLTNVTFTGCVFDSNKAYDESVNSWGGGAFHTAGSAETSFVGCTFKDNIAKRCGGAISLEGATVTCTDCTFTGNRADQGDQSLAGQGQGKTAAKDNVGGGAIILRQAADVLTLNNCTFEGNIAPNGNGGAIASQATEATINVNEGTTFSGNTAFMHGASIFSMGVLNIKGTESKKVTFTGEKTLSTGSGVSNGGSVYITGSTTSSLVYAVFTNCEAGQEEGSTVNYSNGGAISMRDVTSFLMDQCEFSGNRGRNGGCINMELGSSSVCKITNCNFHDNICRSGANKDGTSGNFSGAVARLGGGTVEFEKCLFKKNVVNNASAVLHMNADNVIARFTDCVLSGNECQSNNVCIKMEKTGNRLYMNRCLFEGNHGNTRGMINPANNTLVYLNDVTFKDNYTTGGNGWGVNIHANAANICMNNVTSYNNYCSNASPGNCVSFNSDGGWLIVNSSILDKTPLALIRGKSRQITICNDILINNNTAGNVILLQTTGKLNDCGHNVVSGTAAPSSSDAWASTDLQGVAESGLGTLSYSSNWTTSPYYGVYTWSGSLTGFTAATQTEVENAMKAGYTETDSKVTLEFGGSDIGKDFYNWLNSIGALGKDARGETRGTPWWPGAYQQN